MNTTPHYLAVARALALAGAALGAAGCFQPSLGPAPARSGQACVTTDPEYREPNSCWRCTCTANQPLDPVPTDASGADVSVVADATPDAEPDGAPVTVLDASGDGAADAGRDAGAPYRGRWTCSFPCGGPEAPPELPA